MNTELKRRRFLGLFGAVALTPVLPAPALKIAGPTPRAGYARLLQGWAAYHVETGGVTSAAALAPRLGVSTAQANGILSRLSTRGLLAGVGLRKRLDMKHAARHLLADTDIETTTPLDAEPEIEDGKIHNT